MNELSELLDAIDLEFVLQREGVSYKESYGRSGRQLNLKECPACHTSQWKVYMGADSGLGNCFSGSCPQRTFNKWTFFKHLFDTSGRQLIEILRNLAREQGWRPTIKTSDIGLQDLNTLALPDGIPAWQMDPMHEYLTRRGVTADVAEYFSLHFSESGKWTYMDPRGFQLSQDYSQRILIPIFDLDGEMVSFQGRDVTGAAEQRYLFPPGFASAGAYLYNAFNLREGQDTAVVCEGVFDVIQTKRALDADPRTQNLLAIGTFGMHLSSGNPSGDDQLGRLRKLKHDHGLKQLIFLWDGERKAAAAAVEASLKCAEVGISASVALVADGRDPGNSYLSAIQDAVLQPLACNTKLQALKVLRTVKARYKTE